jgi:hypothetical protein
MKKPTWNQTQQLEDHKIILSEVIETLQQTDMLLSKIFDVRLSKPPFQKLWSHFCHGKGFLKNSISHLQKSQEQIIKLTNKLI